MLASFLMGAVAGMRAMTPLAAVTNARRTGALPLDNGAPALLGHPLVAAGALALAAGEMAGDKMKTAPDRIVAVGMIARTATGAIAGAALARHDDRITGAFLGAAAAIAASYLTFNARIRAMDRNGQTSTGVIEDMLTLGSAFAVLSLARNRKG